MVDQPDDLPALPRHLGTPLKKQYSSKDLLGEGAFGQVSLAGGANYLSCLRKGCCVRAGAVHGLEEGQQCTVEKRGSGLND